MTPDDVQAWLDRYLQAWRSYDPAEIGALFTEQASYAYHPWDTGDAVVTGRDAIVQDWLQQPDDPGSWSAEYRPHLVEGDRAVTTGITRYADGDAFHNLWLLRFDGAQCAEFVEWYMTAPPRSSPD
jgi:SnoaL-like domain